MNQLNLFIELTRLKSPTGYMLLFWPCAWGLTIAYDFSNNINIYIFYLLLLSCIIWFTAYILFKKGYKIKS